MNEFLKLSSSKISPYHIRPHHISEGIKPGWCNSWDLRSRTNCIRLHHVLRLYTMESFNDRLRSLIVTLHEINALKFGDFIMKTGVNSPVYFDLRVIVSYPAVMKTLSHLLWEFSKSNVEPIDHICGVPYTALPIASLISVQAEIPMLIRRKETKNYGTRKLIEGNYKKGDKCLIIEDVVTSGSSILETYQDLKNEGLFVSEAIVVVDREQGGIQNLASHGLKMKSLCTLSQIMNTLLEKGKVDKTIVDQVKSYISLTQIPLKNQVIRTQVSTMNRLSSSFLNRSLEAKSVVAVKLFNIMAKKCTNLCLSADVTDNIKLLELASQIGPHICLLKIHVDILKNFNLDIMKNLASIAKEKEFLIMEDRKFADIGHVVKMQYSQGKYQISTWADLVTVHPIPGPGVINGLKAALDAEPYSQQRGCFLVIEMSSEGNLNTADYKAGALKLAVAHSDFITGIVCQSSSYVPLPGMIQLTPGVKLAKGHDALGQQYNSPNDIILNGADIGVVGRGIIEAPDSVEAAREFQKQLWEAYEKRISKA